MIAPGAERIIQVRQRGYKPSDAVMVSLVGPRGFHNPTVLPVPGQHYDWRWATGLDIVLCVSRKVPWRELALAIKLVGPEYLRLWDIEHKRGAEVFWMPIFPADDIEQPPHTILQSGWYFGLDFSPFHEEENEAYFQ